METIPKKRSRSCFLTCSMVIVGLIILLASASAISNLILPTPITDTNVLSELDKARLAEAINLRKVLGEAVWPGFGQANIPMILYNEEYTFLVGIQNPEPGWSKVPENEQRGGPWEIVPGDTFNGEPYYRQRLAGPNSTPEAFTVLVGDQWVASMTTRDGLEMGMVELFLEDIPTWLHPILPYKLVIRIFLGDSDRYISLIQHEAFHAFEGQAALAMLEAGENANHMYREKYPWDASQLQKDWSSEIDFLVKAVRSSAQADTLKLTRQFLAQRDQRRAANALTAGMISYERLWEWEEGLAKYAQVQMLREASASSSYQPVAEIGLDDRFNAYTGAEKFFNLELTNAKTASEQTRFYYTGMLQAMLLDRLMPEWKEQFFEEQMNLEDLLRRATAQ